MVNSAGAWTRKWQSSSMQASSRSLVHVLRLHTSAAPRMQAIANLLGVRGPTAEVANKTLYDYEVRHERARMRGARCRWRWRWEGGRLSSVNVWSRAPQAASALL